MTNVGDTNGAERLGDDARSDGEDTAGSRRFPLVLPASVSSIFSAAFAHI